MYLYSPEKGFRRNSSEFSPNKEMIYFWWDKEKHVVSSSIFLWVVTTSSSKDVQINLASDVTGLFYYL